MEKSGYSSRVISMHTIKPLDVEAVIQAAEQCHAIVTVEEHCTAGGLGEACASVLMQDTKAALPMAAPLSQKGYMNRKTNSDRSLTTVA